MGGNLSNIYPEPGHTMCQSPKAKPSIALLLIFVLKNECLTIPLVRSDVVDYKREAA
jgi:hypothetical protein